MALPCFHKVRESYPDADITLLTNRPVMAKAAPLEAVLGNQYFFDRVLTYPVATRNPLLLASLVKQIRGLHIDTVVNLTEARTAKSVVRDKWFFRVAGAKKLVGFPALPEDFGGLDPATGEYEWEAQKLARRLHELGPVSLENERYWDLRLTAAETSAAQNALSSLSLDRPILAISIGSKMQAKDWELDNWRQLLAQLRPALPGWQLLLIGAAEEAAASDDLLAVWGGEGVNLCGKVSPRVSAGVLQHARLYVGHDSGPMHLAACVGTPCIGIFAARVLPRQWFPRGSHNQIILHKTDCAGCGLETCVEQRKKCILSISPAEVQQAILATIRQTAPQLLNSF